MKLDGVLLVEMTAGPCMGKGSRPAAFRENERRSSRDERNAIENLPVLFLSVSIERLQGVLSIVSLENYVFVWRVLLLLLLFKNWSCDEENQRRQQRV